MVAVAFAVQAISREPSCLISLESHMFAVLVFAHVVHWESLRIERASLLKFAVVLAWL